MERRVSTDLSYDDVEFNNQLQRACGTSTHQSDTCRLSASKAVLVSDEDQHDHNDFDEIATAFYGEHRYATVTFSNPHLSGLPSDFLYHIGLSSHDDLTEKFSDVKYVFMGGSSGRMGRFANSLKESSGVTLPTGTELCDLSTTDRYSMYKIGNVLSISHGMGMPSISILLHELTKMLAYAGSTGVVYVRMGTSGGVGVAPGTVIVTTAAVNGMLEPFQNCTILGKEIKRDSHLRNDLGNMIAACWEEDSPIVKGKTMSTDDFYEGQGRLDGAICDHTSKDKMDFLLRAYETGVRNIEMESLEFAAFTHRLQIPAAMVAVALLNRLEGDQVPADAATLSEYSARPQRLLSSFLRKSLPYHEKSTLRSLAGKANRIHLTRNRGQSFENSADQYFLNYSCSAMHIHLQYGDKNMR
eukprot:CFRG3812T1